MDIQTILIVDDEDDVIQALRFRLETSGYKVLTASNGRQALARLEDSKVDLILADFMMPEVNGLELAERIRSNPALSKAKVVLFSCHAEAEIQARARGLGVLDYLPKMEGAGAIVRRVYAILNAPDGPTEKPATRDDAESMISGQLRFFSEATSNPLHRGRGADVVTEGLAGPKEEEEGLDVDLRRLAASVASFGQRDSRFSEQPRA
jgi:CheY-like chemotaxis protein